MLKQAVPPIAGGSNAAAAATSSSSNSLPPLNTLPQWTRVNPLARSCPRRPLPKDQQSHNTDLSAVHPVIGVDHADDRLKMFANKPGQLIRVTSADGDRQVQYLKQCMAFLQQQHETLLSALHQEVDMLKRENRDLQFRLTIAEDHQNIFNTGLKMNLESIPVLQADMNFVPSENKRPQSSRRSASRIKAEFEQKVRSLETEVLELRDALKEEKKRNVLLEEQLDSAKSSRSSNAASTDSAVSDVNSIRASVVFAPRPPAQPRPSFEPGTTHASPSTHIPPSLDPLTDVASNYSGDGNVIETVDDASTFYHPATVTECHNVIRQLRIDNNKQALLLSQLKSGLREDYLAHRWNLGAVAQTKPDAVTMPHQLQRNVHRTASKKLLEAPFNQQELCLPSTKLSLANKSVERHKRTQQMLNRVRLPNETQHMLVGSNEATSDGH